MSSSKKPKATKRRKPHRYATRDEQLVELLDHVAECEQRLAQAILVIIRYLTTSQGAGIAAAIATVVDFAVKQAAKHPRKVRR